MKRLRSIILSITVGLAGACGLTLVTAVPAQAAPAPSAGYCWETTHAQAGSSKGPWAYDNDAKWMWRLGESTFGVNFVRTQHVGTKYPGGGAVDINMAFIAYSGRTVFTNWFRCQSFDNGTYTDWPHGYAAWSVYN